MRRLLTLMSITTACIAVAGCNPPPLRAVPQQQACNCNGTVTSSNPGAETERFVPPGTRHPRYARAHHRYYGHRSHDYDESSEHAWSNARVDASSYDYRSSSRAYHTGGSAHGYGYAYGDAYAGDASHYDRDEWRDGYGRTYNRARVSGRTLAARMDPWHGYDVDCPDEDGRR